MAQATAQPPQVVAEELEALRAIFGADLRELEPLWGNPRVELKLSPYVSNAGTGESERLYAVLRVTYSAGYPQIAPRVEISDLKGVAASRMNVLEEELQQQVAQLVNKDNSPIVYDLTVAVNRFLGDNYTRPKGSFYEIYQAKQLEKMELQRQLELESRRNDEAQKTILRKKLMKITEEIIAVEQKSKSEAEARSGSGSGSGSGNGNSETAAKEDLGGLHAEEPSGLPDPDLKGWLEAAETTNSRYKCDFEEFETVGRGGFGQVVRCRNRLDGREYAIKKLRLKRDDFELNRKTLREVTSLAKMFHQYIVRYYQAWIEDMDTEEEASGSSMEDESWLSSSEESPDSWNLDPLNLNLVGTTSKHKILYIQMEYCSGFTLRQVIDQQELYRDRSRIWKLFRQVLEALWYIHDTCRLIHRDIKPANVLFDRNGDVKLGDFGLAVNTEQTYGDTDNEETETGNDEDCDDGSVKGKSKGVGTTLYRAPEVYESDNYDEKCDMFSLGIMLYEMLVPPFETGMERHLTLTNLRKSPAEVCDNEVVQSLLQHNPEDRPSAFTLLHSGKLPNKIETETKYFDEVMRIVKTKDVTSPLYLRLVNALFEQPVQKELFYLYDNDLFQAKRRHKQQKVAIRESAYETHAVRADYTFEVLAARCTEVFKRYGAVELKTSLLTPKKDENGSENVAQLLDTSGNVVELPMNLTKPFARWLAVREVSLVKRFVVDRVYSSVPSQRTVLGRQPQAQLQAAYDVVVPLEYVDDVLKMELQNVEGTESQKEASSLPRKYKDKGRKQKKKHISRTGYVPPSTTSSWTEKKRKQSVTLNSREDLLHCELLECAIETISNCGIDSDRILVTVGDIQKQREAFEHCQISDKEQQKAVCRILRSHAYSRQSKRSKWPPLRRQLLQVVSAKQADALRNMLYHECKEDLPYASINPSIANLAFDLFLSPCEEYDTGFFFRVFVNESAQRSVLVAEGGRYDELVTKLELQCVTKRAAMGIRFLFNRIALCSTLKSNLHAVHVLVCSPSETDYVSPQGHIEIEIATTARILRKNKICADTLSPPLASTETLLDYCKERGVAFMVCPRNLFFRVRDVNSPTNLPDLKMDDLIAFLTKHAA